jgi:hypothetical protein
MLFQRIQHPASSSDIKQAYTLANAARRAYQTALNERLPLAHIAEQSERPQYWFANNMLQVVEVYGLPAGEADFVSLTREITSSLKLMDDMATLVEPEESQPRYGDLRITNEQFERYLKWARTVY